ncbi:uncharacterized protein EV420DRAFT_1495543 [Desarmillaria tabescens]|uniref:Uncharacterized protein n=1 Tax=Armillaria tabescens TaxID=1929756 RepID=A0AA39NPW0_ARMTA|nr:uncharacterized protein EV420DRAFT_1495543 [Desarmillaria tabescens]KAK0469596.1 hypothetical protein EV420DRAFT_1495543 [Desarmillaria tabescens]
MLLPMTLQSRIDIGAHPHEQRKPWSSPPEQITLGHGHHIQPIANSLAKRLGVSEEPASDTSLVHRISPHRSNLLSRIQGCEMHDNGDANINGNGSEGEDETVFNAERVPISDFMAEQSPFTSQNATKTFHLSRSATPTVNSGSTLVQMSSDPPTSNGISNPIAIQRKRVLHEDSVPPRGSSQIHADISRVTLTSAISRNAKLRRGSQSEDMDGLTDKVDAVVTNEVNELFRDTLQKVQTELCERQATASDDESPASAFLKGLLPSLMEEAKSRSQSLVPSVHATEPERPKDLPAAPKAMLTSPGVRLVESMLQAGADLTLPDEEPDSIMHATRMSRPSSSYHRKNIPSHTVRSDSRTTRSSQDDASSSRHRRYTSEHKNRSSHHSKSPRRSFSPANRKTSRYDARSPSPRRHRSRSPRASTNKRSTRYDRSRSPYRGRPEKKTHHRDYSDRSPRRYSYSDRNHSVSSKHESTRYDRRRQDSEYSRRPYRESLSPERGVRSHRDSQWIPEDETEHMVYDEPEPMHDLHDVSDVPGVWAFQVSRDFPDILEYSFNVSEEIAAKWNLIRENNWVMAERETRDELFLHLICLPTALAAPMLDSLLTEISQEPKTLTDALWSIQTEWPGRGSLIIEINPGKPTGKVFFPGDDPVRDPAMTFLDITDPKSCQRNIHNPLEITHTIREGVNTIRFIQLADMDKSFFLLASHRDIPTLDLTALDEILQFRTP